MKRLFLGGARSGKSRYAERIALSENKKAIYIATGQALDSEMLQRIDHHKKTRDKKWHLVEEPVELAKVLKAYDFEGTVILVDCLTLWLSNCLHKNCWLAQREDFLSTVAALKADVILVSNEVGSGVVPLGEMSRVFVDNSGQLHQQLASICDEVKLIVAGLPLVLK